MPVKSKRHPAPVRLAKWLAMSSAVTLLTACATVPSEPACPALPTYPRALMTRAGDELDRLPEGSALAVLVTDYGRIRAACRAMEGES
jgi:hypothetical protein